MARLPTLLVLALVASACDEEPPPTLTPTNRWDDVSTTPAHEETYADGRTRTVRLTVPYTGTLGALVQGQIDTYPDRFGVEDPDASLRRRTSVELAPGVEVAIFERRHADVPVHGGELRALGFGGSLRYIAAWLPAPMTLSTTPTLNADAAIAAVAASVTPQVGAEPELVILDTAMLAGLEGGAPSAPVLTWRLPARTSAGEPVTAFLSARTGALVWTSPLANDALDRRVYDGAGAGDFYADFDTRTLWHDEDAPIAGVTVESADMEVFEEEAPDAHFFASRSYNFWLNVNGWDSYDGRGTTIHSVVDFELGGQNAYWFGQVEENDRTGRAVGGFFFDRGMVARDVVAHEYTHAVMDFFGGDPEYRLESGAVDESMSDVFGALLDDGPNMWTFGEDTVGGVLRDISDPDRQSNPGCYSQRQRFDPGVACSVDPDTGEATCAAGGTCIAGRCYSLGDDDGAVHSTSAIASRAMYLLHQGSAGAPAATNCPPVLDVTPLSDAKVTRLYSFAVVTLGKHASLHDIREGLLAWCDAMVDTEWTDDLVTVPFERADCDAIADAHASVEIGDPAPAPLMDAGVDSASTDAGVDGPPDAADTGPTGTPIGEYTVCHWFSVDDTDRCDRGETCPADAAPISITGTREHPTFTRTRGVPTKEIWVTEGSFLYGFYLHTPDESAVPNTVVHGEYPPGTAPGAPSMSTTSSNEEPLDAADGEAVTVSWRRAIDQPLGVMLQYTSMNFVWGPGPCE